MIHIDKDPTLKDYFAQVGLKTEGFYTGELDNWFGDKSREALSKGREKIVGQNRPDEDGAVNTNVRCWSPTTAQLRAKYGEVGENQTMVECPYPLRLDWDLEVTIQKFSCHKLVCDEIRQAMEKILATYGLERIQELGLDRFGGCLNVRKKRGGSSYSTHAWGIAVDWFPSANTFRETSKTARFATPAYKQFMDIWQNLGWMSLGRCYDFDWMHFQRNP